MYKGGCTDASDLGDKMAGKAAYTVVMMRHGESAWNAENKFCGWYDADLAETGVEEAKQAGLKLKEKGYMFDMAYTSVLKRAIKTLFLVQEGLDIHWIPVTREWKLNERMYGGLTGLNKSETAAKHGEEQVKIWRRSYDIAPPPIEDNSPYNPAKDPKYKNVDKKLIPKTECLKDTVARVAPYWNTVIIPQVKSGKRVIIAAHGNTVRALMKTIDNISDKDIMDINIPTAIPLVYEFDANMKPIKHFFLASDEDVKAALDKVAAQGKAK
jgi:2,3-bisphosphoglycerate-dependent phosphoglycerate mutase